MDDSETDLVKLVNQLARRVPNLELDSDVVKTQVQAFKASEASILKSAAAAHPSAKKAGAEGAEESAVAKLVEEIKSLPSRIAERLSDGDDSLRRRRSRMVHPRMFDEMMHLSAQTGDPVAILMAASYLRDDAPWLYELAAEVYRAVKSGDPELIEREIKRLRRFSENMREGPFLRTIADKETQMWAIEFPRMLEFMLRNSLDRPRVTDVVKRPPPRRRTVVKPEPSPE